MEYLKPIEQLQSRIRFNQRIIFGLFVLIVFLIVAVPHFIKGEPYLIQASNDFPTIVRAEPWKLSTGRIEGFTKEYLEARFHWSVSTFPKAKDRLKSVTTDAVYGKLKDSLSVNESLVQNQKAESYYALERESFSASLDQAEIQITRVIRIRNVALATPLFIRMKLKSVPITDANPYGLALNELSEEQVADISSNGNGGDARAEGEAPQTQTR